MTEKRNGNIAVTFDETGPSRLDLPDVIENSCRKDDINQNVSQSCNSCLIPLTMLTFYPTWIIQTVIVQLFDAKVACELRIDAAANHQYLGSYRLTPPIWIYTILDTFRCQRNNSKKY